MKSLHPQPPIALYIFLQIIIHSFPYSSRRRHSVNSHSEQHLMSNEKNYINRISIAVNSSVNLIYETQAF